MHSSTSNAHSSASGVHNEGQSDGLLQAIDRAAHLLPAQGPITVFIHHNTLHALEDSTFSEAVEKGAKIFGCHPYMTEDKYLDALVQGRIRFSELQEVLEEEMGSRAYEALPCFGSRADLRLAMLQYPLQIGPTEELIWYVAEMDSLRRVRQEVSSPVRARMIAETRRWVMRDLRRTDPLADRSAAARTGGAAARLEQLLDRFGESTIENWSDNDWEEFTLKALWRVCQEGVRDLPSFTAPPASPFRHRDLLLQATAVDADELVHPLLIRFCAAFLDQGLAHWRLPYRDDGFFQAFSALYRQPLGPPEPWMTGLASELRRIDEAGIKPLDSIRESLEMLGISKVEWEPFIAASLLALRGWGGMVQQAEVRGDRTVHPAPPGSLVGFLAVRLILDRLALAYVAQQSMGFAGPLRLLRQASLERASEYVGPSVEQRAFLVFQLAQLFGVTAETLFRLDRSGWATLISEIESFSGLERRKVFHLAYERRFYMQTLDAVALHAQDPFPTPAEPRFQAVFCVDEREESTRRHLEELAPDVETLSTAGYFSIPIYYKGAADAHYVPLCPAAIRPSHWVVERALARGEVNLDLRTRVRRFVGRAQHHFHTGTRSITGGALLTAAVGMLASVPLVARTLFPRKTGRVLKRVGGFVDVSRDTRLVLERTDPVAGPEGGQIGFSLEEMTAIADKQLREIGLTTPGRFARVVLIVGHGSTSMNNPHESAHDCGACGGARGGPNARALAQMLNDPRVRAGLAARGLVIPGTTVFAATMHNTSSDAMTFYDVDLWPDSHREELRSVQQVMERVADRDAHERARRFHSAPLTLSFEEAREHVEGRAEDLAQVRPEWGHATNAISIVARRSMSRGLFLDRRAFLVSYDPTLDDEESRVLERILQAVVPVCAGISLEYYFSYIDNPRWGCGTKLPHNITSLLGVMDGAASDLRTGLPWQMVEIHEPVRLLMIIEATTSSVLEILARNPNMDRLCRNRWFHLAVIHPETRTMSLYQGGEFYPYQVQARVLPRAVSSVDWYRGWRDHLDFAQIGR